MEEKEEGGYETTRNPPPHVHHAKKEISRERDLRFSPGL
jgi:hypothetical protein